MKDRRFLPVVYVQGTYYQVGHDVGRTFRGLIEEFVSESTFLNDELLPAYETPAGKKIYNDTVELLNNKFPHYMRELQGVADGSKVPFHKLMLLHIDSMILEANAGKQSGNGCSTILCNSDDVLLGHTEDAFPAADNHCYVVHAEIDDEGRHEKFSALCYAGHLPGFCMSVNQHGLVYSINIIEPVRVHPNKTPRHFLTRALLAAHNLVDAQSILRDYGTGSAQGFCVNMTFTKQEGPIIFHSAEVGPAENDESQLCILNVSHGECHSRCNKFLRLTHIPEDPAGLAVLSSNGRHRVFDSLGPPSTTDDVINMLSNHDDPDYPIYRRGTAKDIVLTISTGIFDFKRHEWRLYADNPKTTSPIAVFPLNI